LTGITVDTANASYSSVNGILFDKSQATLVEYPGGLVGAYTIPASVTSIRDYGFVACFYLTSVTIGSSVTSIGAEAFEYDGSLTNVTIPNTVTTIGTNAFLDCSSLTSVSIPDSVTSIGDYLFDGCNDLTNITVAASNPDYSSLGGVLFDKAQVTLLQFPGGLGGSYTIPASVTSIGDGAFEDCSSLTSVTMPDSVTSIGQDAFGGCTSLTSIIIGNGVTSIGNGAFEYCPSLTSVTIPYSVTSIGSSAFASDDSLTSIYFLGNSPTPADDFTVFSGYNTGTVYYQPGTTGWGTLFDGWPMVELGVNGGGTNLVVNGGFETGDFTGWTLDSDDASVSTGYAHSGIYGADFGQVGSLGYLSQTLSTTPGTNYYLSFWLDCDGATPNEFQVSWDGNTLLDEANIPDVGWTNIQFTVTATGNSTVLQFGFRDDTSNLGLDDVSVVPTQSSTGPPPFTWTTNAGAITITGYNGEGGAVTIPDTIDGYPVTAIEAYAFWDQNQPALTSVTIPNSVTSIGDVAFGDCLSLTNIAVNAGNASYVSAGGVLFDKAMTTLIQYPTSLAGGSSYAIPNGVTSIDDYAFFNCNLTSVTIPDSVTSIGQDVFGSCYSLTSVSIPDSVTSIGDYAFAGCNYLTNITVDASNPDYSSLGGVLFDKAQVTLLQYPGGLGGNYTISNTVTSIGDGAFDDCESLTNITIPASVTNIANDAFTFCANLTSVTIGNGVTSIGYGAFSYCSSLTSVTIPDSVTSINYGAFQSCTSLTNVTIGNGVTNIGSYAFYYCTKLTGVYFLGNSPIPTNDTYVFYGDNIGTVYYLPGTTGWGTTFDGWPTMLTNIVSEPLVVETTSIPGGTNGVPYNQTLSASGGQTPYSWTNISGALPSGVALTTNGVISGTPTANGTFNFTVKVTDANSSTATQALSLVISPSPNLLVNGGFENEPNWGNGIGVYDPGETELIGSQIPGWTIVTNHAVTVQIASGPYLTISGNYSVNTDGEGYDGNNSNFYQDFATQNGLSYALEFNWQSWGAYTTPTTSKLEISVVDTVTTAVLFDGLYSYDGSGPHPVHDVLANFTGTGNPLRLRIQETPQSGYNDNTFVVDNFSVTVASGVGAPVPSGLVAWWPGDGNALDIAGGNNGTLVGGVTYTIGEVGQAFDLDGTSGYVVAPASASLNVGVSSGLTVEGWIDPASTSTEQPIVEWNNGTNLGAHFWISAPSPFGPGPGCLYANLIDTTGGLHYFASPAGLITANTFQHVALTYDTNSGLAVLYINGASVAQQNLGVFTPQTSYNVYLGYRPGGAPITYWDGLLDEIRIYNRALSSNEIAAIYDAEKVSGQPVAPELSISISSGMGTTISGSGHFTLSSSPGVGSQPQSVVAADVNGDGRLDLIANGLVLTNNGSGGFGSNTTYAVGSSGSTCVVAADVNGDGKPDLITANAGSTTLTVLTNNGSGVFGSNATLDVNSTPQCVVAADVNGDGKPDLICVSSSGARFMTVFTNNGSGVFGLSSTPANGNARAFSIVAADINGDGKPDLITANFTTDTLTVFTNNGSGVFGSNATYTVGSQPRSVVAVDVNGDDKLDLISANSVSGTLTVLTNNGSGVFGSNATYNVGSQPRSVVAADVNGDGKVDLICANAGGGTLTVLTNNGSGAFGLNATYTVGNAPYSVVAADVNGDGLMDLVSANEGSGTLTVLTNTAVVGTGAFHNVVLSWPTNAPGFGLQQNFNLATTNWLDVTNTPIVTNDLNQVTLPAAGKNNFFQLFHQ
jgi:hypothetical protein